MPCAFYFDILKQSSLCPPCTLKFHIISTNFSAFTFSTTMSFERLIRFVDEAGKTQYGNLVKVRPVKEIEGSVVEIVEGNINTTFKKTGKTTRVKKASTRSITSRRLGVKSDSNQASITVRESAPYHLHWSQL